MDSDDSYGYDFYAEENDYYTQILDEENEERDFEMWFAEKNDCYNQMLDEN